MLWEVLVGAEESSSTRTKLLAVWLAPMALPFSEGAAELVCVLGSPEGFRESGADFGAASCPDGGLDSAEGALDPSEVGLVEAEVGAEAATDFRASISARSSPVISSMTGASMRVWGR